MVPPYSDQVSRVWPYSGSCAAVRIFTYVTLTLFGWPSHAILLTLPVLKAVRTPKGFLLSVCPLPRSLATTYGISFDVSSSPYLDVSVQAVSLIKLCIHLMINTLAGIGVSPFGHPRIITYLRFTVAYRSLSRPSSAPSDKAFTLCSLQLNLFGLSLFSISLLFYFS